jgi:hypothetical protein
MTSEPQGQPEPRDKPLSTAPEPLPPRKGKWLGIFWAIADSIADQSATPLLQYVKAALPHLKNVLDVLVLIAVVALAGGCFIRGCVASTREGFLNGRLDEKGQRIADLEAQQQKAQQQYNVTITQLKIDYNERIREKDAEIARVTSERDNALMRERQAFLLPENLHQLVSNATAFVSMDYDIQRYGLRINGLFLDKYLVGNAYFVPLTNGEIFIQAYLLGQNQKSVANCTIEFWSTLDMTNIITDFGQGHWQIMAGHAELKERPCKGMKIVSENTIRTDCNFDATAFRISTNTQEGLFLARIEIYGPGTRGEGSFPINFINMPGRR